MPLFIKSVLIWLVIAATETVHGIIRARFLAPKVGDLRSRQIGVFTGSLLFYIITFFSISWLNPQSDGETFLIGTVWLVLMVLFEVLLGRYVFKFPWKWLIEEYNVFKGKLLLFGMIFLFFAPYIVRKLGAF